MAYGLLNSKLHEIVAGLFIFVILLHHVSNKEKLGFHGLKTIYFIVLCFSLFGSLVTGILLSDFLFKFIRIRGIYYYIQILHLFFAYLGFLLLAMHVGKYLKVFFYILFRRKRIWKYLYYGMGVYGMYACLKEKFFEYIFLRQHFVIYMENGIEFLLNYLCIFIFFSILGYWIHYGIDR